MRMNGIYDQRTLKALRDLGVSHLSFDFRPRSFNFLQQHVFFEMVSSLDQPIFAHFQNEADFMIFDFLNKAKEKDVPVILEFSDVQSVAYYNQFRKPFWWRWNVDASLADILRSPFLKGVIFPYQLLLNYRDSGQLNKIISTFQEMLKLNPSGQEIAISLALEWGESISMQVVNAINPTHLDLSINSQIESCYRNVDLNRLERELALLNTSL